MNKFITIRALGSKSAASVADKLSEIFDPVSSGSASPINFTATDVSIIPDPSGHLTNGKFILLVSKLAASS
jgi:hypothetical protein